MKTVNMHEAKTHLSRLVEDAVRGEPFLIARAGKRGVGRGSRMLRRRGSNPPGACSVPDNFDSIGAEEICVLFESAGPNVTAQ